MSPMNSKDFDVVSLDEASADDYPSYAADFLDFIDKSVTAFHAIDIIRQELLLKGWYELLEREVGFHFLVELLD